jgi:hypothetical protein
MIVHGEVLYIKQLFGNLTSTTLYFFIKRQYFLKTVFNPSMFVFRVLSLSKKVHDFLPMRQTPLVQKSCQVSLPSKAQTMQRL